MPFPVPLATYWGFPRIQRQVPALTEASEDRMASFWRNGYLVFPGLLADEAVGENPRVSLGCRWLEVVGGHGGKPQESFLLFFEGEKRMEQRCG